MPRRTKKYKDYLLESLQTPEDKVAYLNAALEDLDMRVFLRALRDVADAQGVGKVAADARLNRENVYRMLSEHGNPTLSSLQAVLHVFGLKLQTKFEASSEVATVALKILAMEDAERQEPPEQLKPAAEETEEGMNYESFVQSENL